MKEELVSQLEKIAKKGLKNLRRFFNDLLPDDQRGVQV